MSSTQERGSRREQNKRDKLARIVAAADELFAERDVDDVTTLQIAQRAGIGTGTLFLYVASKAELLLLVQNARYAAAITEGTEASIGVGPIFDALLAFARPLVRCNRRQVDNGRHYLREILFGPVDAPRHADGMAITASAVEALARIFERDPRFTPAQASLRAAMTSNVILVTLIATTDVNVPDDHILERIAEQVHVLIPS